MLDRHFESDVAGHLAALALKFVEEPKFSNSARPSRVRMH